jgi:predicted cupin superfamily sugar epimerase
MTILQVRRRVERRDKEGVTVLDARAIIERLGLIPHPEGGYFREVFRSPAAVVHPAAGPGATRAAMTSIYYLLEAGDFSAWHRVRSDEAWCLLAGGPLELHLLQPSGASQAVVLGTDLVAGQQPQAIAPAGWWQAASPAGGAPFALSACIVAPGFDDADFEMADRKELAAQYPTLAAVVARFSR